MVNDQHDQPFVSTSRAISTSLTAIWQHASTKVWGKESNVGCGKWPHCSNQCFRMKFKLFKIGNHQCYLCRAISFPQLGAKIFQPNLSYDNVTIARRNWGEEAMGVNVGLQPMVVASFNGTTHTCMRLYIRITLCNAFPVICPTSNLS